MIHQWYPNVKAELTLMSTAVKADLTTHSAEMETALGILHPGQPTNTRYQNDIALIINKGKAGNLTVGPDGRGDRRRRRDDALMPRILDDAVKELRGQGAAGKSSGVRDGDDDALQRERKP